MTRETIKEYILQVKSQDGTEALYNRWEPDILVEVINQIYNDHEAQLKAKDEEIAKYQIAIDKQRKRAEALKQLSLDKDNEIATAKMRHKLEHDRYLITEAIIKEKDEEIERLKDDVGIMQHIVSNYKLQAKQARSIVAMLFWEWRKHKRMYELTKFGSYLAITHLNNATLTKIILDKAYKMIKEQQ